MDSADDDIASISSFQLVVSLAFLVLGEPKFQHVFVQDNLAASVTNILLQCRLYVVQRPGVGEGVTFYISEYGDVRAL